MELLNHERLQGFSIKPYRMRRLDRYKASFNHDRLKALYDDNVADMLKAQGFHINEAPRSIYHVEKLFQALSGYAPNPNLKPLVDNDYQQGIALARACFACHDHSNRLHVLPFTPETISRVTSNPSGSAGLTNYGCTKAESQTRALERGLQTLRREKQPEPCLAFVRTQFNDKTRLVWGYPYSMTAIEGLVAWPLIQHFKRGTTPMAFAMTTFHLGTKLRVSSYHKEWAYSVDMSQFDATISRELIHEAFSILRTWYDPQEVEPISGKTIREIFNTIEWYFTKTAIVMPNGYIYIGKDHGVPSGSFFTQMVDSVVNVIVCGTIASRFNLNVNKDDIFVLGDDLLFWSNRKIDLDVIADYANKHLGVKMHGSEKSAIYHYDEAVHYLGRDWENGLPTLSEDEIIKRMVFPESHRKYSDDPVEKRRQVKMLILSYASVYRHGWRIASRLFGLEDNYRACGSSAVDPFVFSKNNKVCDDMDPKYLSGLQRYQRVYTYASLFQRRSDVPVTPVQYWL